MQKTTMTIQQALKASKACITDDALARTLGCSRSTISKWRNGHGLPHLLMRKHVLEAIAKLLQERAQHP